MVIPCAVAVAVTSAVPLVTVFTKMPSLKDFLITNKQVKSLINPQRLVNSLILEEFSFI